MAKPQITTSIKPTPIPTRSNSIAGTAPIRSDGWKRKLPNAQPPPYQKLTAQGHRAGKSKTDPPMVAPEEHELQQDKQPFNVTRALQKLTIRPSLGTKDNVTILTLNMDGLRTKYKKKSLIALTHHLQFTIGVITETNLLPQEVDALTIPKYQILDKTGDSKHKGGVLIIGQDRGRL